MSESSVSLRRTAAKKSRKKKRTAARHEGTRLFVSLLVLCLVPSWSGLFESSRGLFAPRGREIMFMGLEARSKVVGIPPLKPGTPRINRGLFKKTGSQHCIGLPIPMLRRRGVKKKPGNMKLSEHWASGAQERASSTSADPGNQQPHVSHVLKTRVDEG